MKNQVNVSTFFIYSLRCLTLGMARFLSIASLFVTSLFVTSLSIANYANAEPGKNLVLFENSYTAKLMGFSVIATSRLTSLSDDNYEMLFKADSVVGSITETSQVRWNAVEQTVKPYHYSYKRASLGKDKDSELSINWSTHTVTNLKNKKNFSFDSTTKMQDSLSYQLQMRQDLIAGKSKFEYVIANGRKIKKYRFEIVEDEILNTPLGEVKTVKVKRTNASDDTVIHAWFAKDFQYLLVQLQQEENGSAYTIYLSKAALNGKAIEHF